MTSAIKRIFNYVNPLFGRLDFYKQIDLFRIETLRLIIRDFEKKDKEFLRIIANKPEVYSGISYSSGNYTSEQVEEWIKISRAESRIDPRLDYRLAIELKEPQRFLGSINLTNIDFKDKSGEIGYFLDSVFWGRGYMYEAATSLINYAFYNLDLQNISAYSDSDNSRSESLLNKLGFAKERILEEARIGPSGALLDVLKYQLKR